MKDRKHFIAQQPKGADQNADHRRKTGYGCLMTLASASAVALCMAATPLLAGGPGVALEQDRAAPAQTEGLKPRLIVRFKEETQEDGPQFLQRFNQAIEGLSFDNAQPLDPSFADFELNLVSEIDTNVGVFELGGPQLDAGPQQQETLADLAARLSELDEVEYAEPDGIATIQTPLADDKLFKQMWHLTDQNTGVRVGQAWPAYTGEGVIVAVLDTGDRPHRDLKPNRLDGYDFVSVASVGNDGDGRDPDASDPGDWCRGYASSWHGTHVAGTIAAVKNTQGVVGVAHNSEYVPVRVLGKCGGYVSDIARYALTVPNWPGRCRATPATLFLRSRWCLGVGPVRPGHRPMRHRGTQA